MVYFVDYVCVPLDPRLAALVWLLFGLAAICGTLVGGRVADLWGAAWSLKLWLALQVIRRRPGTQRVCRQSSVPRCSRLLRSAHYRRSARTRT